MSALDLARRLVAEFPDGIDSEQLWARSQSAGLAMQDVDRAIDSLREHHEVTAVRIEPSRVAVIDLSKLDSVRMRVKGVAHWITFDERAKFGAQEYLLVREPKNAADASAVAVYGRGRKVGFVSASRAASMAPLLDTLGADAYRVGGSGASEHSSVLWVDVPKLDGLRRFVRDSSTPDS
jgi:hypothetical protein